ncbi:MAG: glycosyltransferase family 4 protein [Oscillospiraceae bacterium]|nr:glycosyltransferase family 4 protein [Oscillospiraceae bacterium]
MLILYITYIDFGASASGSAVRPQKMYRAFLDEGHEVKLLCGAQGDFKTRKNRLDAVAEVSRWLDDHRPDLCYIESPVYPILWSADRKLIRRVHRMGIPIGYFYRDFYWKFPGLYPRRRDLIGAAKERFLDLQQARTDALLKCADIVYFPSEAASAFFSYKDMRALPPAGEGGNPAAAGEANTSIYVGGLSGDYGGEALLRAFAILNSGQERYPLLLVCREREWAGIPEELKAGSWLEIHHTSGDGLLPLYERASLAVIPVRRNPYTDISVNIKFYEYMSYGLPVASTDVTAIAALVELNGVGRTAGDTPEEIAENIRVMFSDREQLGRWAANARRALKDNNLWIHRARQVVRELSGKGR